MTPINIDVANHAHFNQIKQGTKVLLTRHNKEYDDGKYYKDLKVGDMLKIVDNKTSSSILVEVTEVQYFNNLDELFKSGLANESFNKIFESKEVLSGEYEQNRPGYSDLIDKDGVVVWRIRPV